ncbi:MAG: hypothetical protein IKP68_01240, partial [Clostridia bacterium]|nr:hypothetical protein [Clostridia bacterium]
KPIFIKITSCNIIPKIAPERKRKVKMFYVEQPTQTDGEDLQSHGKSDANIRTTAPRTPIERI